MITKHAKWSLVLFIGTPFGGFSKNDVPSCGSGWKPGLWDVGCRQWVEHCREQGCINSRVLIPTYYTIIVGPLLYTTKNGLLIFQYFHNLVRYEGKFKMPTAETTAGNLTGAYKTHIKYIIFGLGPTISPNFWGPQLGFFEDHTPLRGGGKI